MAPEIFLDSPYDAQKADVWSLAIMYCSMILGRFPWKVAALYDEAFKRFATSKRPNLHAERGMGRNSTAPPLLRASDAGGRVSSDLTAGKTDTLSMIDVSLDGAADMKEPERVSEPCRPLSQLPNESRESIRNMLLLNARNRVTLEQISDSHWIQQNQQCAQQDSATMHYGPQHEHVLRHG
jgi:serine/threonine protein kinase